MKTPFLPGDLSVWELSSVPRLVRESLVVADQPSLITGRQAGSREQGAGSRELGARSGEQGAGSGKKGEVNTNERERFG